MYFLSAAYSLRDAITAERAEERAKITANKNAAASVAKVAAPAKPGRHTLRFSLTSFGFPLIAPFHKAK